MLQVEPGLLSRLLHRLRDGRPEPASWLDLAGRPAWAWIRQYVFMGGFVDGWRGRLAARSTAQSVYLRYAMLLEIQDRDGE